MDFCHNYILGEVLILRRYVFYIVIILILIFFQLPKFNKIDIKPLDDIGTVKISIDFLLPIDEDDIGEKIHIVSENPDTEITKSHRWKDERTLEIFVMEKELPKGYKTRVEIDSLKTNIPGIRKRVKFTYRASISPFLAKISPVVPRNGPIVLNFSTPIRGHELQKNIQADFNFEVKPHHVAMEDGKFFRDFSKWYLYPSSPLESGRRYSITHQGELISLSKIRGWGDFTQEFQVAKRPTIVATVPNEHARGIPLYFLLKVDFDHDMEKVDIRVKGMKGDVILAGDNATFKPYSAFMPGKTYDVVITGRSIFKEDMDPYVFSFTTVDIEDDYWVEINLRPVQKVIVYKGDKAIRTMLASGGLDDDPDCITPKGIFYLKDRGASFWAENIQEGGLYWVRIKGNYLIHSLPRGRDDVISKESLEKLGLPASHGCIRLRDHEAKWFYDTIPKGTMVVIHD